MFIIYRKKQSPTESWPMFVKTAETREEAFKWIIEHQGLIPNGEYLAAMPAEEFNRNWT